MSAKKDIDLIRDFYDRLVKRVPVITCKLFGSRARGDNAHDSDYDVFIVVEKTDGHIEDTISDIAWEVSYANGIVITPIVYSIEEVQRPSSQFSLFLKNIEDQGVTI